MNEPQDIKVKVWDTEGMPLEFTVPWDANVEEWETKLKLIMVFLQFSVDEVVINPGRDDLDPIDEPEEKEDDGR